MSYRLWTLELVNSRLEFCPVSGLFRHARAARRIHKGEIAGTVNGAGYISVSIDGVRCLAHRLAWFVSYGEWPDLVDHVNGIRTDNRLCNLRNATQSLNMANQSIRKDNTTGFKGVSYFRRDGTYMAQIRCGGKYRFLGYYRTPQEAHEAYMKAARELAGEFARAS